MIHPSGVIQWHDFTTWPWFGFWLLPVPLKRMVLFCAFGEFKDTETYFLIMNQLKILWPIVMLVSERGKEHRVLHSPFHDFLKRTTGCASIHLFFLESLYFNPDSMSLLIQTKTHNTNKVMKFLFKYSNSLPWKFPSHVQSYKRWKRKKIRNLCLCEMHLFPEIGFDPLQVACHCYQ